MVGKEQGEENALYSDQWSLQRAGLMPIQLHD